MKKLILATMIFFSCQEERVRCNCTHSFEYLDDYTGWKSDDVHVRVYCDTYEQGEFDLVDNHNNIIGKTYITCE